MEIELIRDLFKRLREQQIYISLDGDSIRVNKTGNVVPASVLEDLRRHKTEIVAYLKRSQRLSGQGKKAFRPHPGVGPVPLSFAQERMWFIDQLYGSAGYHLPFILRVQGDVDVALLQESFLHLIRRHEVLRSIYLEKDGMVCQQVISAEDWRMDYEVTELRGQELATSLTERIDRPFQLSADYMLRAELIRTGVKEHLLVIVMHHIAGDGWSSAIVIRELTEIYKALRQGRPVSLPRLRVQYASYAYWQRETSEQLIAPKLAYWLERLSGAAVLDLQKNVVRSSVQSNAGGWYLFQAGEELTHHLQEFTHRQHVTLFVTLLSVFNVLLYQYSGQDDICVGTAVAYRPHTDLEGLIGFFVNTVVIRSDLSGNPAFDHILAEVRKNTLEAFEHQEVPFHRIVEELGIGRGSGYSPLFQVLFTLNNNERPQKIEAEGMLLEEVQFEETGAKFDLSFNVIDRGHGLEVEVTYRKELFSASWIQQLSGRYLQLLRAAIRDPQTPIRYMGTSSHLSLETNSF